MDIGLLSLPDDVLLDIVPFMSLATLLRCKQLCRRYRHLILANPQVIRNYSKERALGIRTSGFIITFSGTTNRSASRLLFDFSVISQTCGNTISYEEASLPDIVDRAEMKDGCRFRPGNQERNYAALLLRRLRPYFVFTKCQIAAVSSDPDESYFVHFPEIMDVYENLAELEMRFYQPQIVPCFCLLIFQRPWIHNLEILQLLIVRNPDSRTPIAIFLEDATFLSLRRLHTLEMPGLLTEVTYAALREAFAEWRAGRREIRRFQIGVRTQSPSLQREFINDENGRLHLSRNISEEKLYVTAEMSRQSTPVSVQLTLTLE